MSRQSRESGAKKRAKIYAMMVIEIAILNRDRCLIHIWRNVFGTDNKPIVVIAGILPEQIAIAVEIGIDGFGNRHLVKANFVQIFLIIEE